MLVVWALSSAYAGAAAPITQKSPATVFSFAYIGMDGGADTGIGGPAVSNPEAVLQHANDLYTLINDGLAGSKYLAAVKFEPRLTAVQRAIKEQKFTEKDLLARIDTTPSGAAKAQKLASLIGANVALIGSIDKYVYAPDKGEVEMTATVQMVDVATGKVVQMFTATGRGARGGNGADADELAVGTAATYDAAEKILTQIMKVNPNEQAIADDSTGTPVAGTAKAAPKKNKGLIPAMIGAVVIGFLIAGH